MMDDSGYRLEIPAVNAMRGGELRNRRAQARLLLTLATADMRRLPCVLSLGSLVLFFALLSRLPR